ncbi:ABC transporter permease [Okeania sp. SIO1I7]|uniref:ABC transporter permease n=1 Tax=Okeania sp. SIO1I7 TaxID=2607772 RepID=UPI0025E28EF4|nr:ABC transporter permease [Okeania sp. SIO1I7]
MMIKSDKFDKNIFKLIQVILPELIGFLGFITIWQILAMHYSSIILPSPLETLVALKNLATANKLTLAILTTTLNAISGFTIATLIGSFLGIIAGIKPLISRAVRPLITALQGVPPIAWIVIALLWFGTGNSTSIFTVAVATLPIIFIGAVEGVRNINSQLIEMAFTFKIPIKNLLLDLYYPHLLSSLFPSITSGLGLAWRVAIMSELLSSETGIGAEMNLARINLDTAEVMAWVVVTVVLILISEYLVIRPIRRFLEPWNYGEKNK